MEPLPVHYNAAEYVETMTGNKVSRKALLLGISNIRLSGKVSLLHSF